MKTILAMAVLLTGFTSGRTTPERNAEVDLIVMKGAIAMFKLNAGQPPPADSCLQALIERPRSFGPEVRWTQIMNKLPQDPWGKPYCYVVGDGFPDGYGIYSRGPDGTSATQGNDADDLNNWRPDGPGLQSVHRLPRHELLWTLGIAGAGAGLVFAGFRWGVLSAKRRGPNPPPIAPN